MHENLLSLLGMQIGHFVFESGHHGNLWLDLDRLFDRPALLRPYIDDLGTRLCSLGVEAVCGPMTGGAFIANLLAAEFDLIFAYTERVVSRSDDGRTAVEYQLPGNFKSILYGSRIAVVDDVINAGSAVRSSIVALGETGLEVVGIGALILLGKTPRPTIAEFDHPVVHLASLHSELWLPGDCPLCQSGMKIDRKATS